MDLSYYVRKISLFLLFSFSLAFRLEATHIVGGELSYKCLGNNMYELSLTIFRDCDTGVPWFDSPASIGVFDGVTNRLITHHSIGLTSRNDTLTEVLQDPCLVIPPNVCIHTTTYTKVIELPYNPNGYTLAYQRCCRNADIVNIVDPLNTGATYMVKVTPEALASCNNSPSFIDWPSIYLCKGYRFEFDHSAIDLDGDSLVYELCSPFNGATPSNPMPQPPFNPPYDSIRWLSGAGYSTSTMLGGGPDPLSIDRHTGLLTVTPTISGTFVVGIRVKEYRNGQVISEVQRDFQYIIGECGRQTVAEFNIPSLICTSDLTASFVNTSTAPFGFDNFEWDFGVPNISSDVSTLRHPIYTYPAEGEYTVRLIASPGTVCSDTAYQTIRISYADLVPDFNNGVVCDSVATVTFNNLTQLNGSTVSSWHWSFGDGSTSTLENPTHTYTRSGSYGVVLSATLANGCVMSTNRIFTLLLSGIGTETILLCNPDIPLVLNANADTTITYTWTPSTYLSDPHSPSPTMTVDDRFTSITYHVEMSVPNHSFTCQSTANITVIKREAATVTFEVTPQSCGNLGRIISYASEYLTDHQWSYYNDFRSVISISQTTAFNIQTDSAMVYYRARALNGCDVLDSVLVRRAPEYIETIIDLERLKCDYQINLGDLSVGGPGSGNIIGAFWTISYNGRIIFTSQQPYTTFYPVNTGLYTINLQVTTDTGCQGFADTTLTLSPSKALLHDTVFLCTTTPSYDLNPNGSALPNYYYRWSPATDLNSTTIMNPTTSTNVSRTYYVTITNLNSSPSCQFVDSVRVERIPPIVLDISPYNFVCGNSADLQVSATGGHGNITYEWSTDINFSNIIATTNPVRLPNAALGRTYYVRASDASCCRVVDSIFSNGGYTDPVIADFDYTINSCGETLTVQFNDLSPHNNIVNWTWLSGISTPVHVQNPVFTIPNSGDFTFYLQIELDNGCTANTIKTIHFDVPRLHYNPSDTLVCSDVTAITRTLNSLSSNYPSSMQYQWHSPNMNITPSNIANPTVTITDFPATFIVTITANNGGMVCENIDTVNIIRSLPAFINLPEDTTLCYNQRLGIEAIVSNVSNIQWAYNRNFSPIAQTNGYNFTANLPNNTELVTVYLRGTDMAGCSVMDSMLITNYSYFISTDFTHLAQDCNIPNTVAFNAQVNSNYPIVAYNWDFANGSHSQIANPSAQFTPNINNFMGSYPVELTVRDVNNCIGTITKNVVFVSPTLSHGDTICATSNTMVLNTNNPNPSLSYNWAPNSSFTGNDLMQAEQEINITNTTTFTVTITDNINNCAAVKNIIVTPSTFPYQINTDSVICNSQLDLLASGDNSLQYTWSLDRDFTRIISYSNPYHTNMHRNTTYYLEVKNAYGCSIIDSIHVTKSPSTIMPDFTFQLLNCDNNTVVEFVDLSNIGNNIIQTFNWNFGDGNTSNLIAPSHEYLQNGVYAVSLELVDNLGCSESVTRNLHINNFDHANLSFSDTICLGNSIVLNPNPITNINYNWNTQQAGLNDYNTAQPIAVPFSNTIYTAQINAPIFLENKDTFSCAAVVSHEVIVEEMNNILPQLHENCLNENSQISITLPNDNNITNYTWSPSNLILSGQGSNEVVLGNFVEGSMVFVDINNVRGCHFRDSAIITTNTSVLNADFTFDLLNCQDSTSIQFIDLSQDNDNNIVSWNWNFGDGNTSTLTAPLHDYLQSGIYTIRLEITNDIGCTHSIEQDLHINTALTNNLYFKDTLCAGGSIVLNPNPQANFNYIWNTQQAGLNDYNVAQPTAVPFSNTIYTAQMNAPIFIENKDSFVCNLQVSHEIIIQNPSINLPEINLNCWEENMQINLSLPINNNIVSYNWSPSNMIISGQGTNEIILGNFVEGSSVSVNISDIHGCTASDTSIVMVHNIFDDLELFASRDSASNGDTIRLWVSMPDSLNYDYIWSSNIGTNSTNYFVETLANFAGNNSIIYTVSVSDNYCSASDSITIFLKNSICGEPNIFIPNTFTPNGDGLNDLLYVRGNNITDIHFMIYNRWGELVFEAHDQQTPWDGTFKGKALAPDVYGYYLKCKCQDGYEFSKKGNVTILK